MHDALLWEPVGDRIHCLLCPHDCRIATGHRGVCGVRENREGRLVALTYGLVSSVAVDPIEKKPVFHYRPGSRVLSLGSVGCTMRCSHCQNWQISRATPDEQGLRHLAPEAVVALALDNECAGVAFTYNEPVIWVEYVRDVAEQCRKAGLFTVMVTNGYITEAGLDALGGLIDVWRVDVKGFDDTTYRTLCRVGAFEPVLRMAERAQKHWSMHVEVVTNIIPTINDDDATLHGIASWIANGLGPQTPWHVTRFFPCLDLNNLPMTPRSTLLRAREIGAEEGLAFIYVGNIDEPGGEDTLCPQCGALAIGRNGYLLTAQETDEGACHECGRSLGVVEGATGSKTEHSGRAEPSR